MPKLFSYNVSYSPDPAPATITVNIASGNTIEATISGVPNITFSLHPSGNFIQKIVSAILTPIGDLIALAMKSKPADMLNGKTETLMTVNSFTMDGVTITPTNLAMGDFTETGTEMFKLTGKLELKSQ